LHHICFHHTAAPSHPLFPPLPYFLLCLSASWKISPLLCWIFVCAVVSVYRRYFSAHQTIAETRTVVLGVEIQI
jgi:hypothetical protein